jgi:3-hydroxybutyryl-CoA dehydratase
MTNSRVLLPKLSFGMDGRVQLGMYAEWIRRFTRQDVMSFAQLTGDHNPLHLDEKLAALSGIGSDRNHEKIIVHGMLVGSMFGTIWGTYIPGSIYVRQTLDFKSPVFENDLIKATIRIDSFRRTRSSQRTIAVCSTLAENQDNDSQVCIKGEAIVLLPEQIKVIS